jgi:hypothetical protein
VKLRAKETLVKNWRSVQDRSNSPQGMTGHQIIMEKKPDEGRSTQR